jgi:hypothetical protein
VDIVEELKKIDLIVSAGDKLIDVMTQEQPVADRNLIVYALVHKSIRILAALKNLIVTGFANEAQILARALIETQINLDYFLTLAKEDYKSATGRVVAALMLDKLEALHATNFMIGDQQIDKEKWEGLKNK